MQIPNGLEPMNPSTADALASERGKAKFDVAEMRRFIIDEDMRTKLDKVNKVLSEDTETFNLRDVYFMSRKDKMDHALKIGARLIALMKEGRITSDEIVIADMVLDINGPFGLHRAMFIPTLQNQATPEQQELFLKPALNYELLGCYAQTEIGHGSNVQGLETTCTFVPETDEFEVHMPNVRACKWWIGSLGVTATHAIVMAQLIVNGKNYGPNPVVVPIRSTANHKPLKGVTVGDLGPKFGFNVMDNGFLLLDHVRVPRINLMQRYITVSRDGKVSRPANIDPKVTYGTMVYVRTNIVRNMSMVLAKATTIALRYTSMRRQFSGKADKPTSNNAESPVLDYGMVQYRLIPLLAKNYAMFATSQAFLKHYQECMAELNSGNFASLKELHATACGLKRWTSDVAIYGIDTCRHVCGGHGFSQFSGLNEFFGNSYPNIIWEGDNYVLSQQTARFLITQVRSLRKGKALADNQTTAYLRKHLPSGHIESVPGPAFVGRSIESIAADPEAQLDLLSYRAAAMASELVDQMDKEGQSWNRSLVAMQRLCDAHSDYIVSSYFRRHLSTLPAASPLLPVLNKLAALFFLHTLEQHSSDLFRLPGRAAFTTRQTAEIDGLLTQLIEEVREQAVPLVDSFGLSDLHLNSALGRSDGQVYENYLEWAMEDPLNRDDIGMAIRTEWFNKYYKPVLHSAEAKKQAKL
ncbi:hypothetical protein GGI25_005019 [Coemansia spiralis]|uniref:Acyl-coenzyme A oxidase n=2 Tax=Coemansia TaxID=4863 RepID=A0A9W8G403_9FUNG|nr:acyl-CoA dehydrogenase/oxidase C-terminal [Coemansia spiralis]KAJ1989223.1 hypothetical protein EDC05_004810 [Coemansia umbellata]KAJ2620188.1 hypothetical protein GGI26_005203 [Coemansia sp. RSA 1358]KAJ2672648.1 hypothetical protein GGI25_005019 [Coemansia spiralis]